MKETKSRRGKNPKSLANLKRWEKGQSGNPRGAPKRGESWTEIIKRYGDMTPSEAAEHSLALAKQLLKIGDGLTLKEAVVLRVYGALLFEPQSGLLNAFMNRAEGMPHQSVSFEPSQELQRRLEQLGLTLDDIRTDPLAVELFRLAGVDVSLAAGAEFSGRQAADDTESDRASA